MVEYETLPTDEELHSFADPDGTSMYARFEDDGTTLTAKPRAFPMWFLWVCLLVPATAMYAGLAWEWSRNPDPLFRGMAIFIGVVWVPLVLIGTRLLIGAALRAQVGPDNYFVLDRAAGTLTLPRFGVTLGREDLVELIEVRSTHWRRSEGWHSEYILELSALAHGPNGMFIRYPVMVAGYAKPVRRVAAELADLFGVPRRRLVKPLFFGNWRREE